LVSLALLFDGLLRAAGRAGAAGVVTAVQSATALVAGAAFLGFGLGPRAGALAYLAGACFRLGGAAWASRDLWWGGWPRHRRWCGRRSRSRSRACSWRSTSASTP